MTETIENTKSQIDLYAIIDEILFHAEKTSNVDMTTPEGRKILFEVVSKALEHIKSSEKEPVKFDVATPEGRKALFEIMCIARGIDPNQVQSMAKFMNADNNDERSYYPTQRTALAIAQLRMFGQGFYRGDDWNEYEEIADMLSIGFMGFKGFKSEQYKDITSGQPNLDKLQGLPEETKKGILSGIFNRGGRAE